MLKLITKFSLLLFIAGLLFLFKVGSSFAAACPWYANCGGVGGGVPWAPGSPGGGGGSTGGGGSVPAPTQSPSTPAPTPPPPPSQVCSPGSWGGCGSCGSCGHPGQCVSQCNGSGTGWNCYWDPSGCGGGGQPTPAPQPTPPPLKNCSRKLCSNEKCVTQTYQDISCNLSSQCSGNRDCCVPDAPTAPTLNSPSNLTTITQTPVTFSWNPPASWGENCDGNVNRYNLYWSVNDGAEVIAPGCGSLPESVTSCTADVADNSTYVWHVEVSNGNQSAPSPSRSFQTLFHAQSWWQVKDADLFSPADLISRIPLQCTGSCTLKFNLLGKGGYPGLPVYAGTIAEFGGGSVSEKGWLTNSASTFGKYDYNYFAKLIPEDAIKINQGSLNGSELVGLATKPWPEVNFLVREGDLSIATDADLGKKKIALFVTGKLTIQGKINLDDGFSFFGAFSRNGLTIDPLVTSSSGPAVEGLLFTDGLFTTGSFSPLPDNNLFIRGTVVALGGVALTRDLDPGRTTGKNNETPAELIEYAPDIILNFPKQLLRQGVIWREIAP